MITTPCREWQGGRTKAGYGQLRRERRMWYVHRWVWTLANGPIPEGMCILHHCDNPPCFRLDHLFLGTKADNNADARAKGRHGCQIKTHCPRGHPFDDLNTYRYPDGRRGCKACDRESGRRYRAKRKAR